MIGKVPHEPHYRVEKSEDAFMDAYGIRCKVYHALQEQCPCKDDDTEKRPKACRCSSTDFVFGDRYVFTIEEHHDQIGMPYCNCLTMWKGGIESPHLVEHYRFGYPPDDPKYTALIAGADSGAALTASPYRDCEMRIVEIVKGS